MSVKRGSYYKLFFKKVRHIILLFRTYELVVCQQPLHARMCGFGEKDRRPIDPPPIVQLIVKQQGQDNPVDVQ